MQVCLARSKGRRWGGTARRPHCDRPLAGGNLTAQTALLQFREQASPQEVMAVSWRRTAPACLEPTYGNLPQVLQALLQQPQQPAFVQFEALSAMEYVALKQSPVPPLHVYRALLQFAIARYEVERVSCTTCAR